ncbi:MAG: hypothetical protein HY735_13435 [Verrucomicrobia bacterium]|nr:hypothetical protein [Verrucomicrobiota bacterium]
MQLARRHGARLVCQHHTHGGGAAEHSRGDLRGLGHLLAVP